MQRLIDYHHRPSSSAGLGAPKSQPSPFASGQSWRAQVGSPAPFPLAVWAHLSPNPSPLLPAGKDVPKCQSSLFPSSQTRRAQVPVQPFPLQPDQACPSASPASSPPGGPGVPKSQPSPFPSAQYIHIYVLFYALHVACSNTLGYTLFYHRISVSDSE